MSCLKVQKTQRGFHQKFAGTQFNRPHFQQAAGLQYQRMQNSFKVSLSMCEI